MDFLNKHVSVIAELRVMPCYDFSTINFFVYNFISSAHFCFSPVYVIHLVCFVSLINGFCLNIL